MNLFSIYKPNKKSSGHAMSLHISKDGDNAKGPALMLEMVKQSGFVNGRGTFKHPEGSKGVKTVVKLNEAESADIIYSLEKNKSFSAFHKFGDTSKQVKIVPSGVDRKIQSKDGAVVESVRRVSLGVTDGGVAFYLFLEAGESQLLIESLRFYLNHLFQSRNNA
tara:strand:- start:3671 stop:4162 length:492 start_codon:yes stop_codon:yes gene_type:complete